MKDIRLLSLEDIGNWLKTQGEPRFRAKQIYHWLWQRSAQSFEEMTNLSKALRQKLEAEFYLRPIQIDTVQNSADGTTKTRFKLHDDLFIETVLIPVPSKDRYTVCVSTQVGCSLTCSFCATGQMGRVRNLDPGEIYDQYVAANQQALEQFDHPLTNVVYMGMGEPLLNYAHTLKSIEHLTSPDGLDISPRRITISTAGIAKMIKKLADDEIKCNLALSLHAANDSKRSQIMPINETNTLAVLMDSLDYFYKLTGTKVSYEYIAFQGFNDSIEDAKELANLCKLQFPVKVNIIEYNAIDNAPFTKSDPHQIDRFANYLESQRVTVTIRRSRGKDIDAACGQLANKN